MALTEKLLLLSMAAQALLAFIIIVALFRERVPRVVRGDIDVSQVSVDRSGWHLRARLLSNSFDSQFQLPVLFYVAALVTLYLGRTGWPEVALAWCFVILRYAHAFVHTTTNPLYLRFFLFAAGLAVLALFWLWLVIRILLTPSI